MRRKPAFGKRQTPALQISDHIGQNPGLAGIVQAA